MKTLRFVLLTALVAATSFATASAQQASPENVQILYRGYAVSDSGTTAVREQPMRDAVARVFAANGRAVPTETGAGNTRPVVFVDGRTFELYSLKTDGAFVLSVVSEGGDEAAGVPADSAYNAWSELFRLAAPADQPLAEQDGLDQAAFAIVSALGWQTPSEPPVIPIPPDSFYVYGPNPNTTGNLRMRLPEGFNGQWVDALGRVVSTGDTFDNAASGVYFAVATERQNRSRQVRRMLVVR